MKPRDLPAYIHAAAHPSCCAGSIASVECDLLDRIKAAIAETSTHICSYCSEALPVSLDEPTNLAIAHAHMTTCLAHPMRGLIEAAEAGGRYSDALRRLQDAGMSGKVVDGTPELDRLFEDWHDKTHAALAKLGPPRGEFASHADVEIPEKS